MRQPLFVAMGSMLPLVGAAAHIGPPAAVCKVVRRALAAKPPLGDQGEVAGRRPDGGDQSWQRPEAYNPSVTLRVTAPFAQGSLPSQASGLAAFGGGAARVDIYGVCVHRGCIRHGGAVRAGIKPAPTPRFQFSRRGGLHGRPDRVPIPAKVRWFHRRRGALYMRPSDCRKTSLKADVTEQRGMCARG